MSDNNELIIEVGAEGGSLSIRKRVANGKDVFVFTYSECMSEFMDMLSDEPSSYQVTHYVKESDSFEKLFKKYMNKYEWYQLYLVEASPEYGKTIADLLVGKLNRTGLIPSGPYYEEKYQEWKTLNQDGLAEWKDCPMAFDLTYKADQFRKELGISLKFNADNKKPWSYEKVRGERS